MRRGLLLVFVVLLTFTLSSVPVEAKITWKFGHLANEQHIWHKTALKFAELVKAKTGGEIEIVVYPNEQLGKEMELLNMIQAGTADLTISGESMQNWAPKAALIAAPYAFRSVEHMVKALRGDIGKEIASEVTEKVGVIPLIYHIRSPRNLTSNKPVSKPEDAKGLRLRLPNVPLFVEAWKAVGAIPVVMAFSEVFTALQQGVIDAQENPYDLIYSASFYEVQKYVNETEHVIGWVWTVLGKKQFESLSKELQKAVLEAAEEAQVYADDLFYKEIPPIKQKLIEKGMIINSDVDKEAFQSIMSKAVEKALKPEQADLYRRIQALK
ncbi:MAG: TRAP transporter substrate-binding protein [Synergistetes bacterium]|nr:TRAP transporter substrate-binding protein [Synergistota bacterium]